MGLYDYYPQTQAEQQPDVIGQYLRGAFAPGQLQGQQLGLQQGRQELQEGSLKIDQLRQILQGREQMAHGYELMNSPTGPASPSMGNPGGIQNGPQAAVSSNEPPQSLAYPYNPGGASRPDLAANPSPAAVANADRLSPGMAEYMQGVVRTGGNPFEVQKQMMENQRQMAQFSWANDSSFTGEPFLRQMATDKNAPAILQRNFDQLGPAYTQAAFQAGVDARDLNSPDPLVRAHAVNKVGEFIYNRKAIPIGSAPIKAPTMWQQRGIGEAGTQQVDLDTGETKPGIPRQEPTKVGETQDAKGNNVAVFHQFASGGSGNGGSSAGNGGGAGSNGNINITTGMPVPTDKEYNAAKNAQLMKTSMDQLAPLEKPGSKGLSPSSRALVIQALTKEDTGTLDQIMLQEGLRHGLTPEEQQYMTAFVPFLQAAGHAWGQAGIGRLTSTMARQMFETLVPVNPGDPKILADVQANRQNLLKSSLAETGAARNSALYKGSLGPLYDQMASGKSAPTVVRTGKLNGRRVAEYSDGTHGYVD